MILKVTQGYRIAANQQAINQFLLLLCSKNKSILHHFGDTATYCVQRVGPTQLSVISKSLIELHRLLINQLTSKRRDIG